MSKEIKLLILFLSLCISGCTGIKSIDKSFFCEEVKINNLISSDAEVMYREMTACIKSGKNDVAFPYFAIAGVSTWYDTIIRPGEYTTKRHNALIGQTLAQLSIEQKKSAWKFFDQSMKNINSRVRICELVSRVGKLRGESQVFDDIAWSQASEGYIYCI